MKKITFFIISLLLLSVTTKAEDASATIHSVWIEHNVIHTFTSSQTFWNGFTWVSMPQNVNYKGMKIHVDFDVDNAVRQKTWVCVFFYDEDGNNLRARNSHFRAPDGTLTIQYPVYPKYESTSFSDVWLFMPYSEIPAMSGTTTSLKLMVNIMDNSGYSLDTSDWQYFDLTR